MTVFTEAKVRNRSKMSKRILVIGAGVTGLTTALCLQRQGFDVTVVSDQFAPNIVSVVAGALWEYPPAVCGHHRDEVSLARSKEWCMISYKTFSQLAIDKSTGVFMRPVVFYFKRPIKDNLREFNKMQEMRGKVRKFVHDPGLIEDNGINPEFGFQDAYTFLAPMIDTDIYMQWLFNQATHIGVNIIEGKISGNLQENHADVKAKFQVDAIINCAGLGSIELAGDENMYPLRGALVKVLNDGTTMPRITKAHCVSYDDASSNQDMIYLVPRSENTLMLGGLVEQGKWSQEIGLDNYEPVLDIFKRCQKFLPILYKAELDPVEPVRVGLRPSRKQNVRLDMDFDSKIIHNYGHGGSGVTLSWGCSHEVTNLTKQMFEVVD